MSDVPRNIPHFLRVVRALTRAPGPAIPVAAIVTAVSSCGPNTRCGAKNGFEVMSEGEAAQARPGARAGTAERARPEAREDAAAQTRPEATAATEAADPLTGAAPANPPA